MRGLLCRVRSLRNVLQDGSLCFVRCSMFYQFRPFRGRAIKFMILERARWIARIGVIVSSTYSILRNVRDVALLFGVYQCRRSKFSWVRNFTCQFRSYHTNMYFTAYRLTGGLCVIGLMREGHKVCFFREFFFPIIPRGTREDVQVFFVPIRGVFERSHVRRVSVSMVA